MIINKVGPFEAISRLGPESACSQWFSLVGKLALNTLFLGQAYQLTIFTCKLSYIEACSEIAMLKLDS